MFKNLINNPILKRLLLTLLVSVLAAVGVQDIDPTNQQALMAGVVAGSVSLLHIILQTVIERLKAKESPDLVAVLQRLEAALLENRQRVGIDAAVVAQRVAELTRQRSSPPPPDDGE